MSPEATLIVEGIKGKGKGASAPAKDDEESEEGESTDKEAARAAIETIFKAIKGRDPSDEEASELEDGLDSYCMAKGY